MRKHDTTIQEDASPLTDEEIGDIETGRVGCRCARLLGEVKRLRAEIAKRDEERLEWRANER